MNSPNLEESPNDRLVIAALVGDLELARRSIQEGADTRVLLAGDTIIHLSLISYNYNIFEFFLDNYSDYIEINWQSNGLTPLHLAAMHGRPDLAAKLMIHGADRFARDRDGRIPQELAPLSMKEYFEYLSDSARLALVSEDLREVASLLIDGGKATQALLELTGSHKIFHAIFKNLNMKDPEFHYTIKLFSDVVEALPAYWRHELRHQINNANATLARLAPLPAETRDSALARYARGNL